MELGHHHWTTRGLDLRGTVLVFAVALAIVLWTGHHYLLIYAAVFIPSVLLLHTHAAYRSRPGHRGNNAVFAGFLLFIVLVRTKPWDFPPSAEAMLNVLEHGFFAMALCLNLLCWLELLGVQGPVLRVLAVLLLFNLLGFGNELFQNALLGRALWVLELGAWKDLAVNASGSLAFTVWGLWCGTEQAGRPVLRRRPQ